MGFKETKCKCVQQIHVVHYRYNRINSEKSPSCSVTTYSANSTKLTALLPQTHYCSYCVNTGTSTDLTAVNHRTTRTANTCDVNLGSLILPTSGAGEFLELILLFTLSDLVNVLINFGAHNLSILLLG